MFKRISFLLIISLLILTLAACAATDGQVTETATSPIAALTEEVAYTADICINNTRDEAACKDCCDSLDADGAARKACRDTCATHDFEQNSDFVTVAVPSSLGPEGDYTLCTVSDNEQDCKACCDGSPDLQAGDRRFCRDACASVTATDNPPELAEGPAQPPDGHPRRKP
jgi:hypothetical protein